MSPLMEVMEMFDSKTDIPLSRFQGHKRPRVTSETTVITTMGVG